MVWLCWVLSIPANTPKTSPLKQKLEFVRGVLTELRVMIPDGHHGLAHFQLWDGGNPLVPYQAEQSVCGNDETIRIEVYKEFVTPPYELMALGWNEDTKYEHSFYLRFQLLPRELVFPFLPPAEVSRRIEAIKLLRGEVRT